MNDIRRYCLPCSKKAGVLVERVAPSLEKKREARAEANKAKAVVKNAKKREAAKIAGFNVEAEVKRLWKMLQKQENKPYRQMPKLVIVRRNRNGSSGLCYYGRHEVRLQLGRETVDAWETTAHELIHAIGYQGHGHDFYRALKQLTEARWKIQVSSINWSRAGYACDHDLRRQLIALGCVKFR